MAGFVDGATAVRGPAGPGWRRAGGRAAGRPVSGGVQRAGVRAGRRGRLAGRHWSSSSTGAGRPRPGLRHCPAANTAAGSSPVTALPRSAPGGTAAGSRPPSRCCRSADRAAGRRGCRGRLAGPALRGLPARPFRSAAGAQKPAPMSPTPRPWTPVPGRPGRPQGGQAQRLGPAGWGQAITAGAGATAAGRPAPPAEPAVVVVEDAVVGGPPASSWPRRPNRPRHRRRTAPPRRPGPTSRPASPYRSTAGPATRSGRRPRRRAPPPWPLRPRRRAPPGGTAVGSNLAAPRSPPRLPPEARPPSGAPTPAGEALVSEPCPRLVAPSGPDQPGRPGKVGSSAGRPAAVFAGAALGDDVPRLAAQVAANRGITRSDIRMSRVFRGRRFRAAARSRSSTAEVRSETRDFSSSRSSASDRSRRRRRCRRWSSGSSSRGGGRGGAGGRGRPHGASRPPVSSLVRRDARSSPTASPAS